MLQTPSDCVRVSAVRQDDLFQPVRGMYKPAHMRVCRDCGPCVS